MVLKKRFLFEVTVELNSDLFEEEIWDENTEDYIVEVDEDKFNKYAHRLMEKIGENSFWESSFYLEDSSINLISQRVV